ncbi:MAG: hypothetical protein FJ134_15370 [Deltaproteobacteria bacterium]|nr:hypothetical protein [Deltaproteobacteria bacterium]
MLLLGAENGLPSPPPQPSPLKGEGAKGRNFFNAPSNNAYPDLEQEDITEALRYAAEAVRDGGRPNPRG